jgi:predicted CXXCH cytochrome family protein
VRTRQVTRALQALLFLGLMTAAGCVDESDDGGNGTEPVLDAAFAGYSDPDTRQTVCGNCHVTKQRAWQLTAHAAAWDDLQASGAAEEYCYRCHTTNGSSNLAPDTAGFLSVAADARPYYEDVQCEACHGPGAQHVTAPDESQPLTTITSAVGLDIGCGTCHAGTHTPFVEEWASSGHGQFRTSVGGSSSFATDCSNCHEGKKAARRFDPDARFVEDVNSTNYPITCAVCHDPHGGPNSGQLRKPIDVPDVDQNLCMVCHQRRSVPDPASPRGPHSPQGPMLLGEAGYYPPDFQYDATRQATTHGSDANPRLCAGCHVEAFSTTDAATGDYIGVTGHRFLPIPCVDGNGVPTGANDCADTERRFVACAASGCHASEAVARSARVTLAARLQTNYIDVLWKDKDNDGVLDPLPTDSGLLAQVRLTSPCDFSTSTTAPTGACAGNPIGSTIVTVGEGVWFNVDMIRRGDGSMGVHNPFYAEALLLGSLQALRAKYTYLPAASAAERAFLAGRARALGVTMR